ncbi:hypothetical protein FQN49_007275 [Arthroderma sp. PD_2]|nr:hypothetical protein FQN49_007275 [Arthroderma sp. PD_2]
MAEYTILPCVPEDVMELAILERAAFDGEPLTHLMFGSPSPSALSWRADRFSESIADPGCRWVKIVQDGKIVGAALWGHRTSTDWMDKLTGAEKETEYKEEDDKLAQGNKQARHDFLTWLYGVRKRRMGGKPHILLYLLIVHPDYQRRGIGGAFIRDGVQQAEKLGVPAWLEASTAGFSVYKAHGFEVVEEFSLRLADYGGREEDGEAPSWGMLKPAPATVEGQVEGEAVPGTGTKN